MVRKKPAKDRGVLPRKLNMEICGLEGVERGHPESDETLEAVLASLRCMGNCLAKAMETGFSFLNRQDTFWATQMPDDIKEGLGLTKKTVERKDKDGNVTSKEIDAFRDDSITNGFAVYNILKHLCPCLPSTVLSTTTQSLQSAYNTWRESALIHRTDSPPRRPNFSPPYPFVAKTGEYKVSKAGKRHMQVRVSIRTGQLCEYARNNPNARCMLQTRRVEQKDGSTIEKVIRPFRGRVTEGRESSRDEPAGVATLRCFVSGKKDRKAYAAFEKILAGKWPTQDLHMCLQGPKGGKRTWMARMSYEMPMAEKTEGISAAAVFSFTNLIYGVLQDGRTYHRAYNDRLKLVNKQFRGMARKYEARKLRTGQDPSVDAGLADLVVKSQEYYRDVGDMLRRSLSSSRPGSVGHGKATRFQDIHAVQGKMFRVVDWILRNAATDFVAHLRQNGVSELYLLQEKLDVNRLRDEDKQKAVEFPRYRLKQYIEACCEEGEVNADDVRVGRITVHLRKADNVDEDETAADEKESKEAKKEKKTRLLLDCPVCGGKIDWRPGELCVCTSKDKKGFPCLFGAYHDEYKAIALLTANKVDTKKAMKVLMDRRQYRRTDRAQKETRAALNGAKEMNNAQTY